jgi:acyl carrier protein
MSRPDRAIEDVLREFLLEEMTDDGLRFELHNDTKLFEAQILDSLGAYALVGFVRERFGVTIADWEVTPQRFGTVGSIADLVRSKQAAVSRAPGQAGWSDPG